MKARYYILGLLTFGLMAAYRINEDTIVNGSLTATSVVSSGAVSGTTGSFVGDSSVTGKLDIVDGDISLNIGADGGANTRTNNTEKLGRVSVPHYTNAEEPTSMLFGVSNSSVNGLLLGGGTSSMNAVTEIKFYTAANNTTVTGTERMTIDSAGEVDITSDDSYMRFNATRGTGHIFRLGTSGSNGESYEFYDVTAAQRSALYTSGGGWSFSTDGTERMSIDSAGGTTFNGELAIQEGNTALTVGADNGANTLTDATLKAGRIGAPHYTNAEEPAAIITGVSDSTGNSVWVGGGTSQMNAATAIKFYTAANGTTTTGTERMSINSAGHLGVGATAIANLGMPIQNFNGGFASNGNQTLISGNRDTSGNAIVTGYAHAITMDNGGATLGRIKFMSTGTSVTAGATATLTERAHIDNAGNFVLSGQFRGADGSAGAPSHSFDNDRNTGIYSVTGDELGFSAGGSTRAVVDVNGLETRSSGDANIYDVPNRQSTSNTPSGTVAGGSVTSTAFQFVNIGGVVTIKAEFTTSSTPTGHQVAFGGGTVPTGYRPQDNELNVVRSDANGVVLMEASATSGIVNFYYRDWTGATRAWDDGVAWKFTMTYIENISP